jgi:transglutaminase-like putative cysteine protease
MRYWMAPVLTCVLLHIPLCQPRALAQKKPSRRVTVIVTHDVEPFAGFVEHSLPPNAPSQRVVSWEMVVTTAKGSNKGELDREKGPLQKYIIKAPADPAEKMQVTLTLQIDLYEILGPVKAREVPKLTVQERAAHLEAAEFYEHDTEYFCAWIKKHRLVRAKKETNLQFALRVQNFIRQNISYKVPDNAQMQVKVKELGTGELGYFTSEWTGECWALSRIYTCALRANDIPCRQVSGRMLDGAHHVRAEVFFDNIG